MIKKKVKESSGIPSTNSLRPITPFLRKVILPFPYNTYPQRWSRPGSLAETSDQNVWHPSRRNPPGQCLPSSPWPALGPGLDMRWSSSRVAPGTVSPQLELEVQHTLLSGHNQSTQQCDQRFCFLICYGLGLVSIGGLIINSVLIIVFLSLHTWLYVVLL